MVRLCNLRILRGDHRPPHENAVAQLLSAFGIFAVGYLMRPIGGALIGHIGDRFGRRAALTFSVLAMAVPTFLIGLLPGYATLGLVAPIALTVLRVVQGLSVGGEYTSSMVFLVERAPEGRRGLMGALAASGATCGILLGSAVGAGFAASMSEQALETWGWRVPFLFGLVVGNRRLLAAPSRSGNRAARTAQARPDRRDAARSLARRGGLRRLVRVQCGRLLRELRLSRELAADRRWDSAGARARDQFIEHGDSVAGGDRGRAAERPVRTQAVFAARDDARLCRRGSAVLAAQPSLGVAGTAWPARPGPGRRPLRRGAAHDHGGGGAAAGALHGGGDRLQQLPRRGRRLDAAHGDLAGRTNRQ